MGIDEMEIVSKECAKERGLTRYFTGEKCSKGHISERYTKSGKRVSCGLIRANKWRNKNPCHAKEWRIKNKEHVKDYRKSKSAYYAERRAFRKSRQIQATPEWLSKEDTVKIELVYMAREENELTFDKPYHVDHIVPLQGENVCGLHVPWNLRVISAEENIKKGAKF